MVVMMLTLTAAFIVLLIGCGVICHILLGKITRLSDQVNMLERKSAEVESLSERGVRHLADDLMKFYRENTDVQVKRVDEAIKIFDERRAALEDRMNMTRVMADTMVDAFKHRLSEAEQERHGKDDRNGE